MAQKSVTPAKRGRGRPRKKQVITESDLITVTDETTALPLYLKNALNRPEPIRFGYVRVSTRSRKKGAGDEANSSSYVQTFDSQIRALTDAGIEPRFVFADRVSGVKERFSLERLCKVARPGDSISVFRLDRLGRVSAGEMIIRVEELNKRGVAVHVTSINTVFESGNPASALLLSVFGSIAALEREAIIERVQAGVDAAYARYPERFGRPRVLNDEKKSLILRERGYGTSVARIAAMLRIGKTAVYEFLRQHKQEVEEQQKRDLAAFELNGELPKKKRKRAQKTDS